MPDEFKPIDLGSGFTLKFQHSTKDSTQVRAVITNADGVVAYRGPVVSESRAAQSQFSVMSEFLKNHPLVPPTAQEPLTWTDIDDEEGEEEDDNEDDEEEGELL